MGHPAHSAYTRNGLVYRARHLHARQYVIGCGHPAANEKEVPLRTSFLNARQSPRATDRQGIDPAGSVDCEDREDGKREAS